MVKLNLTEITREAQRRMISFNDPVHDIAHVVRVYDWAMKLSEFYPEANKNILTIASWWHDVGRKEQSLDKDDHPQKSAEILEKYLKEKGVSKNLIQRIKRVILSHSHSTKYHPKTIEGKIVHDADKLAWLSTHSLPDTIRACRDGFTSHIMNEEIILKITSGAVSKDKKRLLLERFFSLPESGKFYRQLEDEFLVALKRLGLITK